MADSGVIERKTLQAGDHIFKEGDEGSAAFVVQAGAVEIYKTVNGEAMSLATLGPGAIFGEMALVDAKPRMAAARMSKGGTIIIVSKKTFEDKLRHSDPFIRGLLKILVENLRQIQQQSK